MTEIAAKRNPSRCPSYPGELLANLLETTHLTQCVLAGRLDISLQHLHALLAGTMPVSSEVAALLDELFGKSPGLGLRMQAAYDT